MTRESGTLRLQLACAFRFRTLQRDSLLSPITNPTSPFVSSYQPSHVMSFSPTIQTKEKRKRATFSYDEIEEDETPVKTSKSCEKADRSVRLESSCL